MGVTMTAKDIVYGAFKILLPSTTIKDDTKLAAIGYDSNAKKDIVRAAINTEMRDAKDPKWHSVKLVRGALDGSAKVSEVTKVVSDAASGKPGAAAKKTATNKAKR